MAKNLMTEAQVDGKMEGVLTTLREEATAAKQAMGVEVDNKIAAAAGNGLTEARWTSIRCLSGWVMWSWS